MNPWSLSLISHFLNCVCWVTVFFYKTGHWAGLGWQLDKLSYQLNIIPRDHPLQCLSAAMVSFINNRTNLLLFLPHPRSSDRPAYINLAHMLLLYSSAVFIITQMFNYSIKGRGGFTLVAPPLCSRGVKFNSQGPRRFFKFTYFFHFRHRDAMQCSSVALEYSFGWKILMHCVVK